MFWVLMCVLHYFKQNRYCAHTSFAVTCNRNIWLNRLGLQRGYSMCNADVVPHSAGKRFTIVFSLVTHTKQMTTTRSYWFDRKVVGIVNFENILVVNTFSCNLLSTRNLNISYLLLSNNIYLFHTHSIFFERSSCCQR